MTEREQHKDLTRERNAGLYSEAVSRGVLETLNPMAQDVLRYRYGLENPLSLREVGWIIGKSATTVGKIEQKGLNALEKVL